MNKFREMKYEPNMNERYELGKVLGKGAFGTVNVAT